MTSRWLNILLLIASLFGYLEWGGNNHAFLFQAEQEWMSRLFYDPKSITHPFILIPFLAQIILLITLFQRQPSKWLTYISIAGLGLLLGFMFVIGILSGNFKIIISTLPFLVLSLITIRHYHQSLVQFFDHWRMT